MASAALLKPLQTAQTVKQVTSAASYPRINGGYADTLTPVGSAANHQVKPARHLLGRPSVLDAVPHLHPHRGRFDPVIGRRALRTFVTQQLRMVRAVAAIGLASSLDLVVDARRMPPQPGSNHSNRKTFCQQAFNLIPFRPGEMRASHGVPPRLRHSRRYTCSHLPSYDLDSPLVLK